MRNVFSLYPTLCAFWIVNVFNVCAEKYCLHFNKEFYSLLKIHAKIWHPNGISDSSIKLLFDPRMVFLRENIPEPFDEIEVLTFTFCCLLSRYDDIIFDERELPLLTSNLEKYLKSFLACDRDIYELRNDQDVYSSIYRIKAVLLYFKGYEENPLEKLDYFVKPALPETAPF